MKKLQSWYDKRARKLGEKKVKQVRKHKAWKYAQMLLKIALRQELRSRQEQTPML